MVLLLNLLEFLNQQLREFAHDARHSHGTLSGYLETLYGWIPKDIKSQTASKNLLNEVKRSSNFTKLYVNKIATFSRADSKIFIKKVNIRELINDIILMLSRRFDKARIDVKRDIPHDLTLDADPEKLEQVFINLFTRSAKVFNLSFFLNRMLTPFSPSKTRLISVSIRYIGPAIR